MAEHDVVLRGGRVVDPETGLDGVCDVGIAGGKIAEVAPGPLAGTLVLDVEGLVVAPGFIDLHSHAQNLPGRRLQACDGVTTALDLEAGRTPVRQAYTGEARDGSPIHYGYSSSWAAIRMQVIAGYATEGRGERVLRGLGEPAWQGSATPKQVAQILETLSGDIAEGGVGVGLLLGYAQGVHPEEYLEVARLASGMGVPTFTHCRDLVEVSPEVRIDGAEELVQAAAETGAHMHYCHVNSTSGRHIDRVLGLVDRCRAEGGQVTTEAYPYGSGATAIGAAFLDPEYLRERGLSPGSLTYLPTGETVADEARLRELRAIDPGGIVIMEFLDESDPSDRATLRRSLAFEDAIVASDAMPLVWLSDGSDHDRWPLPASAVTHPRSAGCFSRALRLWRDEGMPLIDAIGRCSLLPARVLEPSTPAMRSKGRVQPGADADIVVFDAERITDQATYASSTRPSSGIRHVLVDGTFVVRDASLLPAARPGRPVRSEPR